MSRKAMLIERILGISDSAIQKKILSTDLYFLENMLVFAKSCGGLLPKV